MSFPTGTPSAANVDQGTDSPAAARTDLNTLISLVAQIIQSYADANGICDLDANGKVPGARLSGGAGSGNDSDLLDGQHGAFYRNAVNFNAGTLPGARFADSSHGNRGGGSLHALATQVVAGFMSGGDKARVDTIENIVLATVPPSNYATAVSVYCNATIDSINGVFMDAIVRRTGTYGTMYVDAYDNYLNYSDGGG